MHLKNKGNAALAYDTCFLGMDTSNSIAFICLYLFSFNGLLSFLPAKSHCPESCDCQQAHHLQCTNRGLRTVPRVASQILEDVSVFSLGGNFIGNISAFDFARYSGIIRLNLQYNQIQSIHHKAFDKLSKLEELYLGHNLLSAIPSGTLQSLKKLTILCSNHNKLKMVSPDLFDNLETLVRLRLDGNEIEVLQDSVFKSLSNLHYLHLESNQLHQIHQNAFFKLTKLHFLNLSHNKQSSLHNVFTFSQLNALTTLLLSENEIHHVGNHVFQNLKRLSKLSLSNNRISHLENEALKGLLSVREFLIDGNELVEIPAGLLDPLEQTEELDFSQNHISNVDSSAFNKLKYLRVLKLKNNRLTSLSGNIFALNSVLYNLDLHGNNWTCDCRLGELKRWMTSAHSQGKLLTVFVQCHHPAALRGKYLDYVNTSQLHPAGNWTSLCERQGGRVMEKEAGEERNGQRDGNVEHLKGDDPAKTMRRRGREEDEQIISLDKKKYGMSVGRDSEKQRREGQEEVGVQGDQWGHVVPGISPSDRRRKRKKGSTNLRSQPMAEATGNIERRRGGLNSSVTTEPPPRTSNLPSRPGLHDSHHTQPHGQVSATSTSAVPPKKEKFDLLRAGHQDDLPLITDPCAFNRHFITNVSVDQVTASTATVHWTTRDHQRYTPGPGPGLNEVHYRVLFDRFGTVERFPRYVYARGAARSVTLLELTSQVTYMVCVEGAVGGSVCQIAPRDHCVGLVTLPEEHGMRRGQTPDLHLVTVATLAGNALLLLVIGGAWLGRTLRRRMQRRKSAVHVRHMYSTRRAFRAPMATSAVSTDFTSYQSSRRPRLETLEEGDLIEFPCERFLDNSAARRDSDMPRFSD